MKQPTLKNVKYMFKVLSKPQRLIFIYVILVFSILCQDSFISAHLVCFKDLDQSLQTTKATYEIRKADAWAQLTEESGVLQF